MTLELIDFVTETDGVELDDFPPGVQDRIDDALGELTGGEDGPGNEPGDPPASLVVTDDPTEENEYATIQGAIDAADAGDVVFIESGTYEERPVIDDTDGLTVRGIAAEQVVVDASDDGQFDEPYGFTVEADGVTLREFTLKGPVQPPEDDGYPASYFGLKANGCQGFVVENVVVEGSSLSEIDLNGVTDATLTGVTADGENEVAESTSGTGIFLTNCEAVTIDGVTTRNNDWGGVGVSAWRSESYPHPAPAARAIDLVGENEIEDSPPLYTEEQPPEGQPKPSAYHTGDEYSVRADTDDDGKWDLKFPLDGNRTGDVTAGAIGDEESLSHTLTYERGSPPQIAELYYPSEGDRDAVAAELEGAEGFEVLATWTLDGFDLVVDPGEAGATNVWRSPFVEFDGEVDTVTVDYPEGTSLDGLTDDDVTVTMARELSGGVDVSEISVNSGEYAGSSATFDLSGYYTTNVAGQIAVQIDGVEIPSPGTYEATVTLAGDDDEATFAATLAVE